MVLFMVFTSDLCSAGLNAAFFILCYYSWNLRASNHLASQCSGIIHKTNCPTKTFHICISLLVALIYGHSQKCVVGGLYNELSFTELLESWQPSKVNHDTPCCIGKMYFTQGATFQNEVDIWQTWSYILEQIRYSRYLIVNYINFMCLTRRKFAKKQLCYDNNFVIIKLLNTTRQQCANLCVNECKVESYSK